ncbi:Ribonuclease H superfamily protein [Abortiporus biennis]
MYITSYKEFLFHPPNHLPWFQIRRETEESLPFHRMNTDQYILCDQGAVLLGALAEMRDAPFIILDCEGQKLGSQTGILSIIGCRARGKSYLIDILAFTGKIKHQPLLQQLFRLLSSPKPLKIMFDGRKDFSEFYHGHGVHLRGVLDLQVADLSSRSLRGIETCTCKFTNSMVCLDVLRNLALNLTKERKLIMANGLSVHYPPNTSHTQGKTFSR